MLRGSILGTRSVTLQNVNGLLFSTVLRWVASLQKFPSSADNPWR